MHKQIAKSLNDNDLFPWHGVAQCSDGTAVLIFPFLRAIWELQQHNQKLERDLKLKWRDAFIVGHFQDRWFRALEVINKLTQLEATMLSENHDANWSIAHRELPLWLDLFHFYVPMLLDATVVALGLIISDSPSSFPRRFKVLFKEELNLDGMKLRCKDDEFIEMINKNREWHDQIWPSNGKSIRDSIVHRLSKWQITTRTGFDESAAKIVNAKLQGEDSDISPEDGLIEISRILAGYCSFLSSLPSEVWISNAFDGRDLITAGDAKYIGGRFLPTLKNVIQLQVC